jgi:hypothetical protein
MYMLFCGDCELHFNQYFSTMEQNSNGCFYTQKKELQYALCFLTQQQQRPALQVSAAGPGNTKYAVTPQVVQQGKEI